MIPALGSALPRLDTLRLDGASPLGGSLATSSSAAAGGGQSFAAAMADVARDAAQSLKGAETASIQGINGQASTQTVVDAVMGAERTLQTAIAVRDKVVSAYLELSRMSI
ncbi:flagellar hook-basal body complex protein FliE [Aureimonas pseudogalii]|jgi:flagellar hook-basal body complex protein FliE|uniref:Flagellar hook-basal body complex protein FliE n=1 Tax=Aureimonas pseudogalii TaxID=1744844 RepID=A0A7W6H3Z4_9HYPH|nr:flagellar hook-basal body complex protein FliE [Aureimonas pseudogalii]MBB3996409.1 flagellar hook-basal body complex protein FliE [Aureimonas pseudogalii]